MPQLRKISLRNATLLLVVLASVTIPAVRHAKGRRPLASATETGAFAPARAAGKVLAVAPFRVLGDEASLSDVAEGLTDDLLAKLQQVKFLEVIPAPRIERSILQASLQNVGVHFDLALTGVVQGSADRVRVIVDLNDAANRRKLWTREFSGTRSQLLEIEDRIFPQVVSAAGLWLNSREMASTSSPPNGSPDVYDLYLQGRDAIRQFRSAKDISTALGFYHQALSLDPRFALAWAGMADASLEMYGQRKESFWVDKALHAALQAMRLNPRLGEAHFALGSVYLATGRPLDAIAELKKGLVLEPDSDEGYRRLGTAYLTAGKTSDATRAYQTAIQLGPYYTDNYQQLADAYLDWGQTQKAVGLYRKITELEPSNAAGYAGMGAAHFLQGEWAQCVPEFQKALELDRDYATYSDLGLAYFYLKKYAEAVEMFKKAVELNPGEEVVVGNLADAYRWSGDKDEAAATYDHAIELANRELQVNPRNAAAMGDLALYYAKKGDAAQAGECIRQARQIDPSDAQLVYTDAVVAALAGHPPEALRYLRLAFSRGYSPRQAANDPELSSVQNAPEFAQLVREFGGDSR